MRKGSLLIEFMCGLIILELCVMSIQHEIKRYSLIQQTHLKFQRQRELFLMAQNITTLFQAGTVGTCGPHHIQLLQPQRGGYYLTHQKDKLVLTHENGGHFVLLKHAINISFNKCSAHYFQINVLYPHKIQLTQTISLAA